jgi:hypothetical protein
MDTVAEYRTRICELIRQYMKHRPTSGEIESQFIADTENDHYQLVNIGWDDEHRIYGCVLHIDIKDGKIWIQHNNTEYRIAEELVALGVPKEHIVLGFQSPYKRQFTEFAVN